MCLVHSFGLDDGLTGSAENSSVMDAYTGGGTVQEVCTIQTPYGENELALLKFSQNASVMNITHPNHPPYKLTLISATNWALNLSGVWSYCWGLKVLLWARHRRLMV